jgi:hypothetical protein
MGKIFTRKQFSDYLGENRAILDTITDYTEGFVPTPTPSPTQVTPTPTPSSSPIPVTPTPTSSLTPTPTPSSGGGFDSDAAAYLSSVLSAGGSLDDTISGATNTLFTELKSNGLYSKINAFYPVLGGVEASHQINGNGNTSFDLDFFNGFTHNVSGMTPQNSSSYATTNYIPLTEHPTGGMSLGIMTNSLGITNDKYNMGAYVTQRRFLSWDYFTVPIEVIDGKYLENLQNLRTSVSRKIGIFQLSSDNVTAYTNANVDGVETTRSASKTGDSLPDIEIYVGNLNFQGTPYNSQLGRICFSYIGDYLTPSELTTMSSIINTFQTTLGRNTY